MRDLAPWRACSEAPRAARPRPVGLTRSRRERMDLGKAERLKESYSAQKVRKREARSRGEREKYPAKTLAQRNRGDNYIFNVMSCSLHGLCLSILMYRYFDNFSYNLDKGLSHLFNQLRVYENLS